MVRKRLLLGAVVVVILVGLLAVGPVLSFLKTEPMLKGINLPSGSFAADKLPGELGRDYFYPDRKDMEFYTSLGMNVFRIAFLWERVQPEINKPLNRDELRRLDTSVRAGLAVGATVILDLHNFGRYRGAVIGSPQVPSGSLADFWKRLASIYGNTDGVMFGLMNEPHDIESSAWSETAQAAISSIRQTGATNTILVAPTNWASAARFTLAGTDWEKISDPDSNFAFEVHQYVDADASGTHGDCPSPLAGRAAIELTTDWMRKHGRKVFLGEFGASTQPECLAAIAEMLKLVDTQSSVWLGWTYFAGGRGWGDNDLLPIPPVAGESRPQLNLLKSFLTK